jgi:hypothetical protein
MFFISDSMLLMGMNSAPGASGPLPPTLKIDEETFKPEKIEALLKTGPTGSVLSKLGKWNSENREAIKYSTEDLKRREDSLTLYFSKIEPAKLLQELKSFKQLSQSEKMNMLALVPFGRLQLTSEQKKEISVYAINLVSNYKQADVDRKNYSNALPPSLAAIRGMAKSGILHYSQFLSEADKGKVKEGLEKFYFAKNKSAMMATLQEGVNKTVVTKQVDVFKEIPISEESQNEIQSKFGNKTLGLKVQGNMADNGYDLGYSNLVMGTTPSDERLTDSMFPMNQRTWGFMPGSDFRLNFQFNTENYDNMAKMTADIMSYTQLKGIPITSKITYPDNNQQFQGRMLFYVDHNIAQLLVNYMKEKKYVPEKVEVSTNENEPYPTAHLSQDDSVVLRGSAEEANDAEKTRKSFEWIVNREKA